MKKKGKKEAVKSFSQRTEEQIELLRNDLQKHTAVIEQAKGAIRALEWSLAESRKAESKGRDRATK